MTPPDPLRPPLRSEADCALTSPQIDEFVGRVRRQPTAREREGARHEAIRRLVPLARRIAGKYRRLGGEEQDDLVQVACLGLVKAVDGYDPDQGHAFLSYAVPTITGELKRHLRDRTTAATVRRRLRVLPDDRAPGAGAAGDRPRLQDRPKVDQEIAPIPPHIMLAQGKKAAKAAVHDPERVGIAAKGMRQKLTEVTEHLPGRHS
jgi:RNA polymerase sigma factor (sigma-70 family)